MMKPNQFVCSLLSVAFFASSVRAGGEATLTIKSSVDRLSAARVPLAFVDAPFTKYTAGGREGPFSITATKSSTLQAQGAKSGMVALTKEKGYRVSGDDNGGSGRRREQTSPCAAELAIVSACIPNQACADCLNAAWEALPSSGFCWEFVDALCPAITTTCSCGNCEQEIEDFYGCALSDATNGACSGGVECGGIPTPPPVPSPTPPPVTAPSPSPPTVSPCAAEDAIVNACIPTQSCADCLNAAWEALPSEGFCWEFVDALCPAITTTCSCGFCEQEIEDSFSCRLSDATNGGCSGGVECGSPTPPPCPVLLLHL